MTVLHSAFWCRECGMPVSDSPADLERVLFHVLSGHELISGEELCAIERLDALVGNAFARASFVPEDRA